MAVRGELEVKVNSGMAGRCLNTTFLKVLVLFI